MADVYLKQGDTAPLVYEPHDQDDATVNLTGASATFSMRRAWTDTIIIDRRVATVDATARTLTVAWVVGDSADAGEMHGEFEITFSNGKIQSFPNDQYLVIAVGDGISA